MLDDKNDLDSEAFWSGFFWGSRLGNINLYVYLKPYLMELASDDAYFLPREQLAAFLLRGWITFDETTRKRLILGDEMRSVLVKNKTDLRVATIKVIGKWLDKERKEPGEQDIWSNNVPEFFKNVWPRQKFAASSAVTEQLVKVAFENFEKLPELLDLILPFLTPLEKQNNFLPVIDTEKTNVFDRRPREALEIMHRVLIDISPYMRDMEEILERIIKADDTLKTNEKFLELRHRWYSR